MSDPLDSEKLLDELENKLARLRALYENYFLGLEKMEPTVPRKEIARMIDDLLHMQMRNTAMLFKFNMIRQRWNTYQMRWGRTLREIEAGTYHRHLQRARRRGGDLPEEMKRLLHGREAPPEEQPQPKKRVVEIAYDEEDEDTAPGAPPLHDPALDGLQGGLGDDDAVLDALPVPPQQQRTAPVPPRAPSPPPPMVRATFAATPAAPATGVRPPLAADAARPRPPVATPRAPAPPASPIPGMSEGDLRGLHERYRAARRAVGKGTDDYQSFVSNLQKQVPDILSKHKCSLVNFDVQVHDNKVVLKAQPKR